MNPAITGKLLDAWKRKDYEEFDRLCQTLPTGYIALVMWPHTPNTCVCVAREEDVHLYEDRFRPIKVSRYDH